MLVVTIGIGADGNALAKEYKKTQTIAQVNNCGITLPTNVTCSNSDSDVQGNQNSLNTIAFHCFHFHRSVGLNYMMYPQSTKT